jgi:hypothetical protein
MCDTLCAIVGGRMLFGKSSDRSVVDAGLRKLRV